jgi:hypothetical protein
MERSMAFSDTWQQQHMRARPRFVQARARSDEQELNLASRRRSQIEAMIADLDRLANELDRDIQAEQSRAGIHDPANFAYPTYAKALLVRRDNLRRSAQELKTKL